MYRFIENGGQKMKEIIQKCPLPIAGLILGLTALGNLIQSYSNLFRNVLGITAGVLFILLLAKLLMCPKQVKKDLDHPVVASVFPTLSMATMLLSTYLKPYVPKFAFGIWLIGLLLHVLLILWFTKKFVLKFNIKQVFPSWFIVYVGIVVASVTSSAYKMEIIGKIAFWFGLITYLILLYLILYRIIKITEMPEPALPTLAILAAPASLLLAGYMNAFAEKSLAMVYCLMALSFIFYLVVLILLSKLLKLKFYPSYSGFTFPLIISGIGMKLTNGFLVNINQAFLLLSYLVSIQEIIATLITLYVLIRYIQFLMPKQNLQAINN